MIRTPSGKNLDFVIVDRITGEIAAAKLKEMLVTYGLDFRHCRGQGVANMSGKSGVQGRLVAENPKAVYIYIAIVTYLI